jgi:hypothetical protein
MRSVRISAARCDTLDCIRARTRAQHAYRTFHPPTQEKHKFDEEVDAEGAKVWVDSKVLLKILVSRALDKWLFWFRFVVCFGAMSAPHRTAPHRTAPHRTAPHRTAPHRTAPHRTAPHRTAPHRPLSSCRCCASRASSVARYLPLLLAHTRDISMLETRTHATQRVCLHAYNHIFATTLLQDCHTIFTQVALRPTHSLTTTFGH